MNNMADITRFIPQRAPFVMVDALIHCDEAGAATQFAVTADNIFIKNNQLQEAALVENIAQTAAARIGFMCAQESKAVPVGFIGAVQNLELFSLPHIGDTIHTRISIKNQIFNATIIEGIINCKDTILAKCEMKIFIQ